jgi:hypothetical protein
MVERFGWFGWWRPGRGGTRTTHEVAAEVVGEPQPVGLVGITDDHDVTLVDVAVTGSTTGHQIGGLGGSVVALEPSHVVDLQAQRAAAAGHAAAMVIAVEHQPAQVIGDGGRGAADVDRPAAGGPHRLDDAVRHDLVEQRLGHPDVAVHPRALGVEVDVHTEACGPCRAHPRDVVGGQRAAAHFVERVGPRRRHVARQEQGVTCFT